MISIIFPHALNQENNKILDLKLKMIADNSTYPYEIILLGDTGRPDLVYEGLDLMMRRAKYDLILWDSTDIIYGPKFMDNIIKHKDDADWIGLELVECGAIDVHPNNIHMDFGRTSLTFQRTKFENWVNDFSKNRPSIRDGFCWYSPSVWKKEWYIKMGGFSTAYPFPHPNDIEFKERCEKNNCKFAVVNSFAYHFQRAHENLRYKPERTHIGLNNKKDISVILQYSTIDFNFLEVNLQQSSKFSDEIIVTMCTHFFDGNEENVDLYQKSKEIISNFPNTKLIEIPYDKTTKHTSTYYHNLSRFIGMSLSKNDWVFFLDADEIVSDEFSDWFELNKYEDKSYYFSCYWYFREPIYQAVQTESAGLLTKKINCQNWDLYNILERNQFIQKLYDENKLVHGDLTPILSPSGNVMVHHFSWVRTKEQMLDKVKNWGHKNDKNWIELIHQEFNKPFDGTDFVHGYQYNTVENNYNIQL